MATVFIVFVHASIFIYEFLRLKKSNKRDRNSFIILMVIAFGLSIMKGREMNIPNPLDYIAFIFNPLSDWLLSIFK